MPGKLATGLRAWTALLALACVLLVAQPAFAQKTVIPDRTYGEGGSREIEVQTYKDGSKTTFVTVKDKNGNIREHHKHTEDPRNAFGFATSDTHDFFDAKGNKTREAWMSWDSDGKTNYWHEMGYDGKGSMNSGNIYKKNTQGQWEHVRWNDPLQK